MTQLADKHVLIFFLDGVGLGAADAAVNPFVTAVLPYLTTLFGPDWYLAGPGETILTNKASLIPTDANLGRPGRPQSATGQAAILTGRNVPQLIGEHYGPKPNTAVAAIIHQGTLFHEVVQAGGQAALLTPYPPGFFADVDSGRRLLSAVPLAAVSAGLPLMTADDLVHGRAISPDFTAQGWRDHLGYPDVPLLSLAQAGARLAALAQTRHFSFFEHWPTDVRGHRGTLAEAVAHLEMVDAVLGSLLDAWDEEHGLLIVTSDHGNIEDKSSRSHTRNPALTILAGAGQAELAGRIHDLTDVATAVRVTLGLPLK
ncbi:MAG: metalloenzyme domain-containing protein [Chloroflexi bacterium]|nr:metalloenzyme domain-containing protein [Chloroflexota bacterium]